MAARFGLDTVLRRQDQLVRRDQALAAGVSVQAVDGHLRRGRWTRVLPEVFVVGAIPLTGVQRIRAGWLWVAPDGLVAGAAAAYWIGVGPLPGVIDLIVPLSRRRSAQPGYSVFRSDVPPADRSRRNGVGLTSASRTCLDLSRQGLRDGADDALRAGFVTVDELRSSLERSRSRRGQAGARRLVAEVRDNPWSRAEREAHLLLRAANIDGWAANLRLTIGTRVLYGDIGFRAERLIIEIDGRAFHSAPEVFEADRARQNLLVADGWTVLRFTWTQLRQQPDQFVAIVAATLRRLRAGSVEPAAVQSPRR